MKCDVWKPRSDQRWQNELRFSIWRLFEQSSFVIIHLLCYWPPVHNSVLKICPKFQVLRSHFFDVNELLDEHCAKWKYFDSNLYRMRYDVSIKGLRSKNSRTSRLPVIFNLKNPSTTVQCAKKSVAGCEIRRFIYCFFRNLDTYQWLSGYEWLPRVGRLGFNSWWEVESLCSASAILRGTDPVSALTRALFILLHSL